MRKLITLTSLLFILCFWVSAQISSVDEKAEYSESAAYTPRQFEIEIKPEKKKKKTKDEEKQTKINSIFYENLSIADGAPIKEQHSINVPVSVFDSQDKTVINLRKEDFKIFVDGEEKEIKNFSVSEEPFNFILIVDVSPSTASHIEEIQQYAVRLISQLRPQDKAMLVKFSGKVEFATELTTDRQLINKAIKKLDFGDGTSFYEAVKFSLQKRINQMKGRKMVVLLTDGVDTTSRNAKFDDSLFEAEKSGVIFFPVYVDTFQHFNKTGGKSSSKIRGGSYNNSIQQILSQSGLRLGQPLNPEEYKAEYALGRFYLNELASFSGGKIVDNIDFANAKLTGFETLIDGYRNQYVLDFQPAENGKINQRRQIKVRVNRPNLVIQARGSYIVGNEAN